MAIAFWSSRRNSTARRSSEVDVVRIGALRNFAGTDYSVVIGPPLYLARAVDAFGPDIVHSHGPFLLGTTAARLARTRRVPLVFTHHTLYEHYTHYVPGDFGADEAHRAQPRHPLRQCQRRGVRALAQHPRSLAPRGVTVPIYEVPTGVPLATFAGATAPASGRAYGIPAGAVVVGTVGRLAEEKNLDFLGRAIARFLAATPRAHALIVGDGPSREPMAEPSSPKPALPAAWSSPAPCARRRWSTPITP